MVRGGRALTRRAMDAPSLAALPARALENVLLFAPTRDMLALVSFSPCGMRHCRAVAFSWLPVADRAPNATSRGSQGSTAKEVHELERDDSVWGPRLQAAFPARADYVDYLRRNSPSTSPLASAKGTWRFFSESHARFRRFVPEKDVTHQRVVLSSTGPLFGCCLFSPAKDPSSSDPMQSHDLYLAGGADGGMSVVSSSGERRELPVSSLATTRDGTLGFAYDPRSRIVVTGAFSGQCRAFTINSELLQSLGSLRAGQLRDFLSQRGLSTAGCVEKADLVDRIHRSRALPLVSPPCMLDSAHAGTVPAVSVDGAYASTAGADGLCKLWRLRSDFGWETSDDGLLRPASTTLRDSKLIVPSGPPIDSTLLCLQGGTAWAGDGSTKGLLATGDKAGQVSVYDCETGSLVFRRNASSFSWDTGGNGWIWCLSFGDTFSKYEEALGFWAPRLPSAEAPAASSSRTATSSGAHAAGSVRERGTAGVLVSAGTDGEVRLWDMRADGGPVARFKGASVEGVSGPIAGLDVSEDLGSIVAGSFAGVIHLFDIRSSRPLGTSIPQEWAPLEASLASRARLSSTGERFTRIAFGSTSLAGACFDGCFYSWDARYPA
jgi:WD40 repeat protein